jgi:hypothetical protein
MTDNAQRHCDVCKADISNDDIVNRLAGLVAGVLLCARCVEKKRQEILAQQQAAPPQTAPSAVSVADDAPVHHAEIGTTKGGVYMPAFHDGQKDIADESLSLIDDGDARPTGSTQIRSFATGSTLAGQHDDSRYKRPLAAHNQPATRVRTFHGKLTEAGVAHMDELVNEWLDGNPDVFIKSSTSSIGVFEGKSKEPHLVLTLFY